VTDSRIGKSEDFPVPEHVRDDVNVQHARRERRVHRPDERHTTDQRTAQKQVTQQSLDFERPGVDALEHLLLAGKREHRVGETPPEVRPVASVVSCDEEVVEVDEHREREAVRDQQRGLDGDCDWERDREQSRRERPEDGVFRRLHVRRIRSPV